MKLFLRIVVLLFAITVPGAGRAAETTKPAAPAATVSPYAPIEPLVGGLWVATLPADKNGVTRRLELRFAWAENHQGVRFDSTWVIGDKRAPYTSGMYAWNAAQGKIVMFYTDSGANLAEGPMTIDGAALVHDLTLIDKNGKSEPIRVRLTFAGPNAFTNEISTMKDGAWAKFVEVHYERSH